MGCGNQCMKFILIIFCIILLVLSGALIGLCVWSLVDPEASILSIGAILGTHLYDIGVIVVLVVSCVIFVTAFIGLCGACRENRCCYALFILMMMILALALLIGAILCLVYQSDIEDKVVDGLTESLETEYAKENTVTDAWDEVQEHMKCCGIRGDANDLAATNSWFSWRRATGFWNVNNDGYMVPASCCARTDGKINNLDYCTGVQQLAVGTPPTETPPVSALNQYLHMEGCYTAVVNKTKEHALIIGIIGLCLSLLIVVAIALACCLRRDVPTASY